MKNKMTLLYARPPDADSGGIYVDQWMETWFVTNDTEGDCLVCEERVERGDQAYRSERSGAVLHNECAQTEVPALFFSAFRNMKKIEKLWERFETPLRLAEEEFIRHYPEKGDSWKTMDVHFMGGYLSACMWNIKVPLSGHLTPESREVIVDELVDIINLSLMLAQQIGDQD